VGRRTSNLQVSKTSSPAPQAPPHPGPLPHFMAERETESSGIFRAVLEFAIISKKHIEHRMRASCSHSFQPKRGSKRILYGAAVRSKFEATRMSAKRHESDECPAAGAIATGNSSSQFPEAGHLRRVLFPVRLRAQPRARKVS